MGEEAALRFPRGFPESWRQGWEGPRGLATGHVLSVVQEDLLGYLGSFARLLRLSELPEGRSWVSWYPKGP